MATNVQHHGLDPTAPDFLPAAATTALSPTASPFAPQPPPAPRQNFLSLLPRELRDEIYPPLFPPRIIDIFHQRRTAQQKAPVTLVCQQLRSETLPLFYSAATWKLDLCWHLLHLSAVTSSRARDLPEDWSPKDAFVGWIREIGDVNAGALRKVVYYGWNWKVTMVLRGGRRVSSTTTTTTTTNTTTATTTTSTTAVAAVPPRVTFTLARTSFRSNDITNARSAPPHYTFSEALRRGQAFLQHVADSFNVPNDNNAFSTDSTLCAYEIELLYTAVEDLLKPSLCKAKGLGAWGAVFGEGGEVLSYPLSSQGGGQVRGEMEAKERWTGGKGALLSLGFRSHQDECAECGFLRGEKEEVVVVKQKKKRNRKRGRHGGRRKAAEAAMQAMEDRMDGCD